jgi:uncharacterized membrane protein
MKEARSYQDLREKWVHEDDLLNHRVTWLLLSQTLLFAAYGVCLAAPTDPKFPQEIERLVAVIPLLGITLAVAVSAAIASAYFAQKSLEHLAVEPLSVPSVHNWVGHSSILVYPVFFILAWAIVLLP